MESPSLGQRWRSVAVPMAFLRLGGQALEFVGWIVFARRLGTSGYGTLAVAFLVARYAGLVADWGASFRGARDVAADGRHGSIRRYVRKRAWAATGLALAGASLAIVLGQPGLAPMAVVVLSLGFSRDWIAIGRERGGRAGLPLALQGGLIAGLSWTATSAPTATLVVAFGYGVAGLASVLLNPLGPEPENVGAGTAHTWILAAVLANQITSSTDTVLLSVLRSSSQAGIYAAVYRIPNAWLAALGLMLGSLLPVATSSHREDREGHLRLRSRSMQVSGVGALVILALIPVSWFLTPLLFGPSYKPGQVPLAILMVATAVITFTAPLHPFAMSAGRDRAYALILVCGAAGNIAANLVIIPRFGMTGAACTTLGAQLIISALLWHLVHRENRPADDADDLAS
jgi:O-antigen/teichoic acid export membrane protein